MCILYSVFPMSQCTLCHDKYCLCILWEILYTDPETIFGPSYFSQVFPTGDWNPLGVQRWSDPTQGWHSFSRTVDHQHLTPCALIGPEMEWRPLIGQWSPPGSIWDVWLDRSHLLMLPLPPGEPLMPLLHLLSEVPHPGVTWTWQTSALWSWHRETLSAAVSKRKIRSYDCFWL